METKNNLEQKIKKMNLQIGEPIEIRYFDKGKAYVTYFNGIKNNGLEDYISGARAFGLEGEPIKQEGYHFSEESSIKKLSKNKSVDLSIDSYREIPLGSIIEIEAIESDYGNAEEGKNIGYFEGLEAVVEDEGYICYSKYKQGTPWYENSAGDCVHTESIKSIKILGEEDEI